MKLGFVTAILPELSLNEVVDFAAATGYECIEVMCWPAGKADRRYAGITHIDIAKLDEKSAREITANCASKNVSISALGYYPNLLTPNADEAKGRAATVGGNHPQRAVARRTHRDDVRRPRLDEVGRRQLAAVSRGLDAADQAGRAAQRAHRD